MHSKFMKVLSMILTITITAASLGVNAHAEETTQGTGDDKYVSGVYFFWNSE